MQRRITLAQVVSTDDVRENLTTAKAAIAQAGSENANWIMFPELYLSGSYSGDSFRQDDIAGAFEELRSLCGANRLNALIGTGWREAGKTYNQVRIVTSDGELAGVYAKTCLTYDDARGFQPGPIAMIHNLDDLCFGCLICNDLWVTPGFTDGPDPRLTLQQSRRGAQVIFHLVGSGSEQRYRAFHESNQLLRAAEAGCPIVTVNAFRGPEVNARSGVLGTQFKYLHELPSDRATVATVEFTPSAKRKG